eukprot:227321-Amphidinium_carterae.1
MSIHLSHLVTECPDVFERDFEVSDVKDGCKETVRVERGVRVVCDMWEGPDGATGNLTGAFNAVAAGGRGTRRTGG